jgi:hypothetical protein
LARTLAGSFLGLLEAIGFAIDGEDLGVVDQAIDQGDDAGGVWKDLAPFGEGPVGGDDRAVVLVTAAKLTSSNSRSAWRLESER